jgi:hypothetical protein
MNINYPVEITSPMIAYCRCGKYEELRWNVFLNKYIPHASSEFVENEGRGWSCKTEGPEESLIHSPMLPIPAPFTVNDEKDVVNRAIEIREERGFSDSASMMVAMEEVYFSNQKEEIRDSVHPQRIFNMVKQDQRHNPLTVPYPSKPYQRRW